MHTVQSPHPMTLCSAALVVALGCDPSAQKTPSSAKSDTGHGPSGHDTGPEGDTPDPAFTLGQVLPCPAPLDQPSWREGSQSAGLPSRPDDGRETREATYLAVHDFDEDGDLDIFLFPAGGSPEAPEEPPTLMRQESGHFTAEPFDHIAPLWQPTLGDMEGDGDLDLLIGGAAQWLRADGADLTAQPMYQPDGIFATFAREMEGHDVDGDGFLDLFVLTAHPDGDPQYFRDYILWGDGAGGFRKDYTALTEPASTGMGFDAQWLDWDSDGFSEIYVANDQGHAFGANRLWQPQVEPWTDLAPELSADIAHSAMGVDAGDLNRDGFPDLYLTASGANVLLMSQPDGTFVDMTLALQADPLQDVSHYEAMGWGGLWVDYDNDGWRDIIHTQGDWWEPPDGPRPEASIDLMRWTGEHFVHTGPEVGIDATGSFRGVVALDFNADGLQDFVISSVFGRPLLYLSQGCTAHAWLAVEAHRPAWSASPPVA